MVEVAYMYHVWRKPIPKQMVQTKTVNCRLKTCRQSSEHRKTLDSKIKPEISPKILVMFFWGTKFEHENGWYVKFVTNGYWKWKSPPMLT